VSPATSKEEGKMDQNVREVDCVNPQMRGANYRYETSTQISYDQRQREESSLDLKRGFEECQRKPRSRSKVMKAERDKKSGKAEGLGENKMTASMEFLEPTRQEKDMGPPLGGQTS